MSSRAIKESGLAYIILRNGWYTENYTASIPAALAGGAFLGAAGEGLISSASRRDFAEALAVAALDATIMNKTYELAGDDSYTLKDLAGEISRETGRSIPFRNLTEAEYAAILQSAGLPAELAASVASWDTGASQGALYEGGHQLSRLIGRKTTPLADTVRQALAK